MLTTATRSPEIPLPRLGQPHGRPERAVRLVPPAPAAPAAPAAVVAAPASSAMTPNAPAVPDAPDVLELRCLYGTLAAAAGTATVSGAALFAAGVLSTALVYWAVALLALAGLLEQGQRHPGVWRRETPGPAPAAVAQLGATVPAALAA